MNGIARFEALAERLVEGTFARLFAGRVRPLEVAIHLIRAMEDHQVLAPDGTPQAPTHYWVYLHPENYQALATERPALEAELATHLSELAAQAGMALNVNPTVHVQPDPALKPYAVRVEARWMPDEAAEVEQTHQMAVRAPQAGTRPPAVAARRPFLILQGQRHVDLTRPVVSIGRALDNDIIVEDQRVSRHHAQLRQRYGRYVLYDLRSSGGTRINGYPVEECVLHAGDVLSLAGVQVIYGEDAPYAAPLPDSEDTPALTPAGPEQG